MKCRTCLFDLKPNSSLPLTTKVSLGKTVEAVLNFFIPEMVKSNFIDECICSRCYGSIKIFTNFVKKFIDVENYFREVSKLNQEQQNDSKDSIKDIIDEEWPQTSEASKKTNYANLGNKFREQLNDLLNKDSARNREKLKKGQPFNEDTNFVKPQKTYLCTKKDRQAASQIKLLETQNSQNMNTTACTSTKSAEEQQVVVNCTTVEDIGCNVLESSDEEVISDNLSDIKCTDRTSEKDKGEDLNSTPSSEHEMERSEENTENSFIFSSYPHIEVGEVTADIVQANSNATLMKKIYQECFDIPTAFKRNRMISINMSKELNIDDFLNECSQFNLMTLTALRNERPKRILFLGRALFRCSKCGKCLSTKQTMTRHIRDVHFNGKGSKNCPVCDQIFSTQLALENHVATEHRESYLYNCDKCGSNFKREMSYKMHMKSFELYQDCRVRKCGVCGEVIRRHVFIKHRRTHVKCDVCGRMFVTQAELEQHRSKHQNNETAEFNQKPRNKDLCPLCGKLLCPESIKDHMASHKDRSFLCEKCPKVLKSKTTLMKHNRLIHLNTERFECSLCEAKTKTISALNSHLRLKHLKEYIHVCVICGKGFTRTDYFKRHMAQHTGHTTTSRTATRHRTTGHGISDRRTTRKYRYISNFPGKLIPCKYCNLKFNDIQKLRSHLLRAHIKHEKRPKCEYCSLTFSSLGNKQRHEKRHKNPQMFELTCSVCHNRFNSKKELDIHFAKHVDSQRRVCEICGETFPSKYFLQHHMGEDHYDKEEIDKKKDVMLSEGLSHVLL